MNTLPMPEILLDTLCRFWSKVDRRSDSECWNWTGNTNNGDYGRIIIDYEMYLVHRISYYIYYKKDPGELLVCHECNNPPCANPYHLFLGTQQQNTQHAFDTGLIDRCGIRNASAKLTEQDIQRIRKLQREISQPKIARLFCVSETTISYIISGKTWTHIH